MIRSELDFIWITTDGKKFLNKRDAEDRQKELGILKEDENYYLGRGHWETTKGDKNE